MKGRLVGGDEVSHFLDDSPTTGLAACQVLGGGGPGVGHCEQGWGRDGGSVSKRVSFFV